MSPEFLVGKPEAGYASLELPVVAMGSIPHIYQRASFSLWATPETLPLIVAPSYRWFRHWKEESCQRCSHRCASKVEQIQ